MAKKKYQPDLFGAAEQPSAKIKLGTIPIQDKEAVKAHFKEIELSPFIPPKKKEEKKKDEPIKEIAKREETSWEYYLRNTSTQVPNLPSLSDEECAEFRKNHKTLKQLRCNSNHTKKR